MGDARNLEGELQNQTEPYFEHMIGILCIHTNSSFKAPRN